MNRFQLMIIVLYCHNFQSIYLNIINSIFCYIDHNNSLIFKFLIKQINFLFLSHFIIFTLINLHIFLIAYLYYF